MCLWVCASRSDPVRPSVCWPFVCALIESFRCPGRWPIVEPVQLICALCSLLAITFTQEHHNVQSFRPRPLRGPGLGFAQRPDAFSLIVIVCGNLISAFSTRVCTFSLPLSSLSPSPSRRHVCPLCVCVFVCQRNFACSCQDLDLFNNAGYVMDLLKACPHVSVLHSPFSACVCHKLSPCPWLEASLFN